MSELPEVRHQLRQGLYDLPAKFHNHWNERAEWDLQQLLFRSLAAYREDYLALFFKRGLPHDPSEPWSLREAQGARDGAEYTEAARGTVCGHIFKSGESTYTCKTCAVDTTCVLCTRCFESSDHEGHQVFISISPGNSGCCDCGDKEAWRREVVCSIHSETSHPGHQQPKQKGKVPSSIQYTSPDLPDDLVEAVRTTVSCATDYLCDVLSCSPEQMRLSKTEQSIEEDERLSRLHSGSYFAREEVPETHPEFALILWNDEKHSVEDVKNQVAKACRTTRTFGLEKAHEVNDVGRSIIQYSRNITALIGMAKIIEELKLTVTIRSARDTFREQMCAAIIDWIADISGCAVGNDASLLRNVVCEEMLNPWRIGSQAGNKDIAKQGLDDHEKEDGELARRSRRYMFMELPNGAGTEIQGLLVEDIEAQADDDDDDEDDDESNDERNDNDNDNMEIEVDLLRDNNNDGSMDVDRILEDDVTEVMEAAFAGYPAPPPPPPRTLTSTRRGVVTTDSEDGETEPARPALFAPFGEVPQTPQQAEAVNRRPPQPSRHWLDKPDAFKGPRPELPCEDLWQRVRLDWLILYDLRLWKTLRISLRHLYITTVVVIPEFRRILGLRFAGLYTPLAELYLIADREPDHSIVNLSVQMLTTPTITEEVVDRGNFLSNLMAILYTFLTTRQVGYPEEVNPRAVLAFDAGTVANRRMFHFFMDLRWLFQSEYIQRRMRAEPRYLLQFLDLAKLHQGICPNVRAIGEHVEYESDAWLGAALIIKEINKLCRQIALAFEPKNDDIAIQHLTRAIRHTAQVAMINSFGYERKRFQQAELKSTVDFHTIGPFMETGTFYKVPKYVVHIEPMSFHHPLHYLLSWLIENAKDLNQTTIRALLTFTTADLKDPFNNIRNAPALPSGLSSDNLLSGLLDPPLRVCAWLAQTKAGMWVRNGITLRHQANSYRNVTNRDTGYQRDILMIQTGLVLIGEPGVTQGEAFLAQMIDRFHVVHWMAGDYAIMPGFEESQQLDVLEDFYHLLVIALSERGNLIPKSHDTGSQQESGCASDGVLQHDIAHALCFKPLSFSDLSSRVTEKVSEADNFSSILESMTNYKAPEGLSDTGVFELKPEYIELIDPYYAHYNRNLREEAENVYRKHMCRKTGQKPEEVVYEPHLQRIPSGIFTDLAGFTRSALFAQVIFAALDFAQASTTGMFGLQGTRVETFLHMVLHLTQIAVLEEKTTTAPTTFTTNATIEVHKTYQGKASSIVRALIQLSENTAYPTCQSTVRHILRGMLQLQPGRLSGLISLNRTGTDSPASLSVEEREKKKHAALARQARVMEQMKQQQNSFLFNQKLEGFEDGEDDYEDTDDAMSITHDEATPAKKTWHFPTGTCILCQEATNDHRLYGTFAFLGKSNILRQTPTDDGDYVQEVLDTPESLDRPYHERPFGVAGQNKIKVVKTSTNGTTTESVRQGLSKGFPQSKWSFTGPVSTSCGHIMHFSCFNLYFTATVRRHAQQIARNQPETTSLQEFICPLCKALGNTFVPIVWKSKECPPDSQLSSVPSLPSWISRLPPLAETMELPTPDRIHREDQVLQRCRTYAANTFTSPLAASMAAGMEVLSLNEPTPRISGYPRNHVTSIRISRPDTDVNTPLRASRLAMGNTEDTSHIGQLASSYWRTGETIALNDLSAKRDAADSVIATGSTLARALGMTISATEIEHRGTSTFDTGTILDDLSEQTITHLRILAETFDSYYCVEILQNDTQFTSVKTRLLTQQDRRKRMLLTGPCPPGTVPESCLSDDMFLFFADWLAYFDPDINEALPILQICLWAECSKVVLLHSQTCCRASEGGEDTISYFEQVCAALNTYMSGQVHQVEAGSSKAQSNRDDLERLRRLIERYALAFLRKCLVLIHVRYGYSFDDKQQQQSTPELGRLTRLLKINSIPELFELYAHETQVSQTMHHMTRYWIVNASGKPHHPPNVQLPHPAILELVGLPKNYDALTEEAFRRRCPTTGKEITDPACCLFCGQIFCSQAVCCMKDDGHGGCWQHMQKCGDGKIGLFINIRKCMMLFMHGSNGSFIQAPYLDRHGEADPTLRRHHQLFLIQRRYDKLVREVWLKHGVQSVISRKLEGDINPGGWESL